tara:strand:- start:13 stop:192 length:180 start_codon:yes stop_codon:yes gene_type:complete
MKTNTPFPIQMHGYGMQMGLMDTETTLTTKKMLWVEPGHFLKVPTKSKLNLFKQGQFSA